MEDETMTSEQMEQRDEIIFRVGCGTEIAASAARYGYTPVAIRDNGRVGDERCVLYVVDDGLHAIDTNGGAHWESMGDGEDWTALVAELIDAR
jgi:hypothetical protein